MTRRALAGALLAGLLVPLWACTPSTDRDAADDDPAAGSLADPGGPNHVEGSSSEILVQGHDGEILRLRGPATRIVSLVPASTETLVRLGAEDRLAGRSDYDTAAAVAHLPSVGGGLQPNLEILRTLEPDVVVAFAGESDLRTARILDQIGVPVLALRPTAIRDIRVMIRQLGHLAGADDEAVRLVGQLDATLDAVRTAVDSLPRVSFVYLLGGTPPLAAGPGTFLSELATLAGGVNALDDLDALYAPVSPEVLREREIQVILMTRGSRVDARVLEGRRTVELPGWVEIPGPEVGRAAWTVARALHPGLAESGS
ncbi:MAG: helical backbone metal receptor [Gemmatimonadota bacterium]